MSYSRGHERKIHRMRTASGEEVLKTAVSEMRSSNLRKEQISSLNKSVLKGLGEIFSRNLYLRELKSTRISRPRLNKPTLSDAYIGTT
jgi:hypothetical protein